MSLGGDRRSTGDSFSNGGSDNLLNDGWRSRKGLELTMWLENWGWLFCTCNNNFEEHLRGEASFKNRQNFMSEVPPFFITIIV